MENGIRWDEERCDKYKNVWYEGMHESAINIIMMRHPAIENYIGTPDPVGFTEFIMRTNLESLAILLGKDFVGLKDGEALEYLKLTSKSVKLGQGNTLDNLRSLLVNPDYLVSEQQFIDDYKSGALIGNLKYGITEVNDKVVKYKSKSKRSIDLNDLSKISKLILEYSSSPYYQTMLNEFKSHIQSLRSSLSLMSSPFIPIIRSLAILSASLLTDFSPSATFAHATAISFFSFSISSYSSSVISNGELF